MEVLRHKLMHMYYIKLCAKRKRPTAPVWLMGRYFFEARIVTLFHFIGGDKIFNMIADYIFYTQFL